MKQIKKDELYRHIGRFLKSKGIELTNGSYANGIHAGCSLLADAINLSQAGIERAKVGFDRKVTAVRQVIHQKTAPKPGASTGTPPVIMTNESEINGRHKGKPAKRKMSKAPAPKAKQRAKKKKKA
jgi:hypothetical protein